MKRIETVGVIGAGIAGLTCALQLHRSGIQVAVLEKSRGVGGRVATRRMDSGVTFDHGAQYFTVRDPVFAAQVQQWCDSGSAAIWKGRIVTLNKGLVTDFTELHDRYVGLPGMNAIARSLATGLDVHTNVAVQSLRRLDGKWHLRDAVGTLHGPYDVLVSTAPPQQTATLLGDLSTALAERISVVPMAPCWSVMLQTREPLPLPYDAAFVHDSPLSWISRNSSKPGRAAKDCWVLHASATWSSAHLEESADTIAKLLLDELWNATGQAPQPFEVAVAHRWRYALPQEPLAQRYLLDRESNLGACGDWCAGPRVEGAFLSGLAIADALLENL